MAANADEWKAEVIPIRSVAGAIRWGDQWERYARRMEMLYELASIQRDMSQALLADALAELERVRGEI